MTKTIHRSTTRPTHREVSKRMKKTIRSVRKKKKTSLLRERDPLKEVKMKSLRKI